MKKILLLATAVFSGMLVNAQLHTAHLFADSMVLQRNIPVPVWGWAGQGDKITVKFHRQVKTTVAGIDGSWKVSLSPEPAGGPYMLTIEGKTKNIFRDVWVGDVWICSGQSNMEWNVANSKNSKEEIAVADFSQIRHIKITNAVAGKPLADIGGSSGWHSATPAYVGNFTAVGYFFAREIHRKTKVPVGLVNTTWGGTDVETWTSREAMENSDVFRELMKTLPILNLDSIQLAKKKAELAKIEKMQGGLPDTIMLATWKEASLNDADWGHMQLPGLWEQQALPDFDGTVWFRKTLTLTREQAANGASLSLGMIDDADETWVNGVKVGATNGYNKPRNYSVAAGILQEGRNTIAIKVDDTGGGGGVYGEPASLQLVTKTGAAISLAGNWQFRVSAIGGSSGVGPNSYPSLLFNAMVNPLIPFAIKGAIWYQGESNAGRAYQYRKAFPLMITDWRKHWKQGDFPFYYVQLASFNAGDGNSNKGSNWAELREAQTRTLSLPNTGMAVTTDIGEPKDIHPRNKQDVGKRLAAIALNRLYGFQHVFGGPTYRTMHTAGNLAVLLFSNTGSGLQVKQGDEKLNGFELAGAEGRFYPAAALIKGNTVVVSASEVAIPAAVRYAWADDAGNANLFNREGFPAIPFRTDNWKAVTEKTAYHISLK